MARPRKLGRPASPLSIDVSRRRGAQVRRRGFWEGPWGVALAVLSGLLASGLLVGWVLAWSNTDTGANPVWLTLGSIAFAALLTMLAALFLNLRAAHRLRHVEAAFLTGASHNLRTPLAGIRAATQTLMGGGVPEEDQALLFSAIVHETSRLGLRIDNLLETARVDLERRPFASDDVDLLDLAQSVFNDARWTFTARGASTKAVALAGHEAPVVRGDARALRLALENLLDNALKYSDAAPDVRGLVEVIGDQVIVEISDKGMGFDPATEERLFASFRRGRQLIGDSGSLTRGSGLGLALTRAIIRGHHGDVSLHSDGLGQGCTATIQLPLLQPKA